MTTIALSIDNTTLYGVLALVATVAVLLWIFRKRRLSRGWVELAQCEMTGDSSSL